MPLYEITTPEGSVYRIEAPEGASQQSLILAARRQEIQQRAAQAEQRAAALRNTPEPAPETTFGGQVKETFKGVIPGAVGLAEAAGTGIAALLPESTEKAARAKLKEIAGVIKKPFEAAPGYEGSVGRGIGEGLGSMLAVAPMALLGPAGVAGGIGVGVAAGAGEARERAEQAGATQGQRAGATALGTIPGAFDTAVDMALAAFPGGAGKAIGVVRRALMSGGIEGATEAAQQVAQNAIAKGVYKPDQELIEGAGEQGAYGAGVGTLASLIMDMAIPGRRRGPATSVPKQEVASPESAPAEPPRLGYSPEPFTPVTTPDGSVITSKAQYDKYVADKDAVTRARAEDRRTSDPFANVPADQRELARRGKQAALDETFGSQEPDLFGEIIPPKPPAAPAADTAANTRDTQTRDMIDEMETADIQQMLAQDQRAGAQAQAAEVESARTRDRLKFESDLAELDGRIKAKQDKTTEDKRLEVLLPLVENPQVKDIAAAFSAQLRRSGFTDTSLTQRETALVRRATDLREAVAPEATSAPPKAPEPPVTADIKDAADVSTLESQIPERRAMREPEQPSLPGMGKRGTAPAPAAFSQGEEAQAAKYATVLSPEVLTKAGLPKQSGFFRELVGKDMADPAQQPAVASVLARVRTNPNLSPATKQAIERVAMQAFGALAKQTEMFGPRGGVLDQTRTSQRSPAPGVAANRPASSVRPGVGASPSRTVPSGRGEPVRTDTAGTQAPKPSGMGANKSTADNDRSATEGKPAALTAVARPAVPVAQATGSARRGTPKPAAVATPPKPAVSAQKPTVVAVKPEIKATPKAEAKPEAKATPKIESAKFKRTAEQEIATENYMQAAKNNAADAIRFLAHDIYTATYPQKNASRELNKITSALVAGKFPDLKFGKEDASGFPGTGGKFAKSFFESLSPADKEAVRKDLENYFVTWEAKTAAAMTQINAQQELSRAVKEQFDSLELPADQAAIMRPLHPGVVAELRSGNLLGALRVLANQSGTSAQIAQRLASAIGATKVEVVKGLKQDGRPVAGLYDPKTDRVKVSDDSLSVHTLLHEATHAATSHVLANKSHPMTKQLDQLFKSVKDSLDTAYGARTLDEFVAEAFSNTEFQTKLAAINPKGEPISALQRFTTTVGNFVRSLLGLPTKSTGSALDAADVLINQIISPAPETRGGAPLALASLLGKGKEVLDSIGARAAATPYINDEWKGRIHEFFTGTAPSAVKNVVRQSLPLNALVEAAQKYIPMAPKLDVLVGEKSGAENKRHQAIEPIIQRVESWAKKNPTHVDALNTVIYTSTIEQVDPSKPRSAYANNAEKLKVWDDLQKDWKLLGTEGQSVYNQMRDTYAKVYADIRTVLDQRIDDSVGDKRTADKIKAEIYQRLFSSGRIEPYFPLMRSGDYWLSYTATDPRTGNREFYVSAFETAYARKQEINALKEDPTANAEDIQEFSNSNEANYRKAPPTSFVNSVLRTLEANKVDGAVTEEVMRMFLNMLPETSFAQSFRRRKGVLGFKHDAIGALRSKTYSIARQLTNMEYGSKFEKFRADMKDYVRSQGNKEPAVAFMKELDARIDYAISPNVPRWSKIARSFGFAMTLGFNASSALINLSQIPLVVMPYLGGKYGYKQTTSAIGRATRYFATSGLSRDVEMLVPTDSGEKKVKVRSFLSIDNLDFTADGAPKHLKALVDAAMQRGQLNRSQIYDILDVDSSDSLLTKVNALSGSMMHHAERMNRQVTLVAAYELELQKLVGAGKKITDATKDQMDQAADYAVYMAELTNGGTAAAAAPRIAQNALGSVMFMYKRYGVSMYYMMFKTARDALRGADDQTRAAAKKQIAGIYASAALMAGVQGIPMFGIASMLYNLIIKGDDDDDFDTAARKWLGELPYSGLGNAALGVEIAGRIGMGDLLFRDTTTRPSDSVMLSLMEQLGGPVFGVASRMERGLKQIADGNVERGLEQMMPSAIANGMKAIRYATEGANTLRGDPILGDVGPWNAFAQMFGFAPAEYTRQMEINASTKNVERGALEKKTNLLRKYYVAMRNGDGAEAADLVKEILEYNKRHPTNAITPDTIQRSMAQHMRTTSEMYHGITLNKSLRPELLQHIAEYEPDAYADTDAE